MPLWTILLLFVLLVPGPLFAVFAGPRHRERRPLALLVAVPLMLFAINAPLHEFAHMIGTWLGGGRVTEYNLVMRFWTSNPRVPMIVTSGLQTPSARITASFFPYGVALAFLLAGLVLGRRIDGSTPWVQALFYLLFVLRPGFDVASNLVSHVCFGSGDFQDLSALVPTPLLVVVETCLALVVALSLGRMIRAGRAPLPSPPEPPDAGTRRLPLAHR